MNAKSKGGKTPLHVAAEKGNIAIVKILVGAGAFAKEKDDSDNTPGDIAKKYFKDDVASYLLNLCK